MIARPRGRRLTRLTLPGLGLMLAGLLKAWQHQGIQTADPFASAWCRSPLAVEGGGELMLMGHCWGCYAAALGALLVLLAVVPDQRVS